MEKTQVCSILALILDDEEEQREKVSRKVWIRPWISRRKSKGAFFTIFQELVKEDSDGFKGSLWLCLLNLISDMIIVPYDLKNC